MRNKLHDLAFRNASDLIQMQAALALNLLRIFRRAKKGVSNHGHCGNGCTTHRHNEFPIRRHCIQRDGSVVFAWDSV
jgi:hypothetical protein